MVGLVRPGNGGVARCDRDVVAQRSGGPTARGGNQAARNDARCAGTSVKDGYRWAVRTPAERKSRPARAGRPVSRESSVFYPGIELVAEATLHEGSDPYLEDHVLEGAALFPAVLGLEAMAQAICALAGSGSLVLERVRFDRPIVAGSDGLRGRIAGLHELDGSIRAVLRSEETGFQADHFSASGHLERWSPGVPCHVGPELQSLALDSDDLYHTMLFHAGRFRRVAGYNALSAKNCVAVISARSDTRWFPFREADDFILGDPAVRDAAMHALQACIPHRRVLPVAVERIWLGQLLSDREYTVCGEQISQEPDLFVFDVEIRDEKGILVER